MNRPGKSGFTLVELVLTLTVVAIISVMATTAFFDLAEGRASGAARKLSMDLSYARRLAQNRNGVYGIRFDPVADTYTVHSYDSVTGSETPVADPLTREPMIVDLQTLPGMEGTDLQSANFAGGLVVRFLPQGIPQDASGISLVNPGSAVIARGGASRSVLVQPNTGEVNTP